MNNAQLNNDMTTTYTETPRKDQIWVKTKTGVNYFVVSVNALQKATGKKSMVYVQNCDNERFMYVEPQKFLRDYTLGC